MFLIKGQSPGVKFTNALNLNIEILNENYFIIYIFLLYYYFMNIRFLIIKISKFINQKKQLQQY